MRVVAGTHKAVLIVGAVFVIFAVTAVAVGLASNAASARADRRAQAAAAQLKQSTMADVRRSVIVPTQFLASDAYGDGGCSEYELGCWTTTDLPKVALTEMEAAVKSAGFVVVRAGCESGDGFCEITAQVGQARVTYWMALSKNGFSSPSTTTDIAGFIAA